MGGRAVVGGSTDGRDRRGRLEAMADHAHVQSVVVKDVQAELVPCSNSKGVAVAVVQRLSWTPWVFGGGSYHTMLPSSSFAVSPQVGSSNNGRPALGPSGRATRAKGRHGGRLGNLGVSGRCPQRRRAIWPVRRHGSRGQVWGGGDEVDRPDTQYSFLGEQTFESRTGRMQRAICCAGVNSPTTQAGLGCQRRKREFWKRRPRCGAAGGKAVGD